MVDLSQVGAVCVAGEQVCGGRSAHVCMCASGWTQVHVSL